MNDFNFSVIKMIEIIESFFNTKVSLLRKWEAWIKSEDEVSRLSYIKYFEN